MRVLAFSAAIAAIGLSFVLAQPPAPETPPERLRASVAEIATVASELEQAPAAAELVLAEHLVRLRAFLDTEIERLSPPPPEENPFEPVPEPESQP